MADQPFAGVTQEQADVARVSSFLSGQSKDQVPPKEEPEKPAPTAEAAPPEQPNSQAAEELTPDDLEVEQGQTQQPEGEAFEIVHNGQQIKLTREEAIKHAMQGFDYTQKTQEVANQKRQLENHLRGLAEIQQVQPLLMQERAQVAAIEQQLAQYNNFNWVQLAQQDPMAYPAQRAQYDVLVQAYQHARQAYDQKEGAVRQRVEQIQRERLASEDAKLPTLIPAWKDQAKRQAESQALTKHFETKYGVPPEELNATLNGALAVSVAYKAWKYDQLMEGKASKVNQLRTAPPVTMPGAKTTTTKADKDKDLSARLRKSGSLEDAAALLANRWK